MPDVIILAGLQFIKNSDTKTNKALLQINGKMMIEYVIDALRKADRVEKIIVVGPENDLEVSLKGKVDAIIDSNGSIMQNLVQGIKYLGTSRRLLVCSSDIPMITHEAINDFIEKSEALEADLCYPIVNKRLNEERFPYVERTYVKIAEGSFTGGNIFYLNPAIIEKAYPLAENLINARKKPLKMARILNFRFVFQLLLGMLSISKIEKKFYEVTRIKARTVISEYPEIGNDVDKPGDIIVATAHLRGRFES